MYQTEMSSPSKNYTVLVIEDQPLDMALIEDVVESEKIPVHLISFDCGEKAIQYLKQQKTPGLRPDLILLDLKLSGVQSLEILKKLRAEPRFGIIPIVILTSIESAWVVLDAYRLGCNCYIKKSLEPKDFSQSVSAIFDFWLNFAVLPDREGAR
ncbi:hypothetical protein COW36_07100 [bacterium (Candidatus Blackallbacteria) CG17_big_fil_post_rev_8_21_14_2_50_48_46]|uniref:Response regulatory domain-containing protein n=1 Tax=bacterium (Candidatus Blackallbacteria) CG17_big_fil_post_rev_8_21_14_2_50_48_46 TaxID=2014261 RepID=A0A2M7G701_9BACT|nr:MAG: hypothetical protein COW64_06610 [bacterium (Candidatus Blackallbacteria) CG18_big_fil_WC_8_21_14_2_50_49_26]PIW17828.1 MAG: hypothetical protein COW36_07100 [bacterium (Candidatus Blackallbacteria) CG17_big_fil_post_rev_8_21_14_2_50_48_46]PIW48504.1 MAG: hypothetical protein COW20_09055 [bacterium (Candidatus Blackallbacteria) CG13_big_fil_rev_8_21_14_2_50_49_14]